MKKHHHNLGTVDETVLGNMAILVAERPYLDVDRGVWLEGLLQIRTRRELDELVRILRRALDQL